MISVRTARKRIQKAFKDDPFFRQTYVDNAACVLMDNNIPGMKRNKERRDAVAERLIAHLFETG